MAKSKWELASSMLMVATCVVSLTKAFVDQKHQDEKIEEAVEKRLEERAEEE